MKHWAVLFFAATISSAAFAPAQGGFLNGLRNMGRGGSEQQAAPATEEAATAPPPSEGAVPPPAERAAAPGEKPPKNGRQKVKLQAIDPANPPAAPAGQKPKATPTASEIKAGAKRLQAEMNFEKVPSNLLSKYAGKWKGDFWVYSPQGKLEQRMAASLEYQMSGGALQLNTFYFDKLSQTWVTAEQATYQVDGDTVRVNIRRANNQTSRQTGHYNDGQLFLVADIKDGLEHFRERIDGNRLLVDGFAVYNGRSGDAHVFVGRFLRER